MLKLLSLGLLAVSLTACASTSITTAATALQAAGYTVKAYCSLAEEGRAEIRRQIGLKAKMINCPGDKAAP